MPTENSPYVAFSFLLLMLLAGSLLTDTAGYVAGVPLIRYSLGVALLPSVWVTHYCFPFSARHIRIALGLTALLALLGFISGYLLDFTPDGMGYQQPSAEALLGGWNPFGPDTAMLWQNIYPSGVWALEASLSVLHGSVEATKMLQLWWLFIALPILLAGLRQYKTNLSGLPLSLIVVSTLSATVLAQMLTHYVDAFIYLSGLTFIGGLLMYGKTRRGNVMASLIMAACVFFVINAKLSGIYHAFMLCAAAVLFSWMRTKRIPWKLALVLLAAGLIAVLFIGYRPYVTSFIAYGPSLFPDSTESFSGAQRPSSFDGIPSFVRFFYSLFSTTGGVPHEAAQLKLPWMIEAMEWKFAGDPDARSGGFGPLFALAFLGSLILFGFAVLRKLPVDKGLAFLGFLFLAFSALFPQSWWARYVPFAYAVPLLFLLSIGTYDKAVRRCVMMIITVLALNGMMVESAALRLFYDNQTGFMAMTELLRRQPAGSVYLVPPVADYRKYNDAYMSLTRRLKGQGVDVTLKVGDACAHQAAMYAEYRVCY